MNAQRIQETLPAILATIIGILFAVYAGSVIGSGQTRTLMYIACGATFVALGLALRANIWLLIPFFWYATGKLLFLPLPFTLRDIGIGIAIVWFLIFRAVRIVRTKPSYDLLDLVLGLSLTSILFAFIRNPVGTLASGSDLIGGRPYLDVTIGVGAYWVLQRSTMTVRQATLLPFIFFFNTIIITALSLGAFFFPILTPFFLTIYSGVDTSAYSQTQSIAGPDRIGRLGFLSSFGTQLSLILFSKFNPTTLLFPVYFIRLTIFAIGMIATLYSGFRSAFIFVIIAAATALLYRDKKRDLIKGILVALPLLFVLVGLQGRAFELPAAVQRTLTFLPGNWSEDAIGDSTHSVEWRTYMWKAMLSDEKYLKNKILGDGFGFSMKAFNGMMFALDRNDAFATQENFLITGGVHSGPLSAIRYVGYLGLALYLWLAIFIAKRAHQLILRAKGTPFFTLSLFIGIPAVIHPFFFCAIFGAYETDIVTSTVTIGFLKVLQRALAKYEDQEKLKPTQSEEESISFQLPQLLDHRPSLGGRPALLRR